MRTQCGLVALSALVAATSLASPVSATISGSASVRSQARQQNDTQSSASAWTTVPNVLHGAFKAEPARLYDSRESGGFVNAELSGSASSSGALAAFETRTFVVNTAISRPMINLTVVDPESDGFLTAWKGGSPRPTVSSINFKKGQVIANQWHLATEVVESEDGRSKVTKFSVYSHAKTHFTIDIVGEYTTPHKFVATKPRRVHDSREPDSAKAYDRVTTVSLLGDSYDTRKMAAVVANITVVGRGVPGFVTVWHEGERPNASTLNYTGDALVSNQVIAKVALNGTFKVYTHSDADVIVDVVGYMPTRQGIEVHRPVRLLDERSPGDYCCHRIKSDLIRLQVEQRPEAPRWGQDNVIVNITVVGSTRPGFVSARRTEFKSFDDETTRATTSTQNYKAGTIRAGMAIVPVSEQGVIELYRMGDAKVIVDLVGYTAKKVEDVTSMVTPGPYKNLESTTTVGRQGDLKFRLPELHAVKYVEHNGKKLESETAGRPGYREYKRDLTIPGSLLTAGSGVVHVGLSRVYGSHEHPLAGHTLRVAIPINVVDGAPEPPTTELTTAGYHWEYTTSRTENRSGELYTFEMNGHEWSGPITVAPGSGYSAIPESEFSLLFYPSETYLKVRMPSQEAMRKYLGQYGGHPDELTLNAKTADGTDMVLRLNTARR